MLNRPDPFKLCCLREPFSDLCPCYLPLVCPLPFRTSGISRKGQVFPTIDPKIVSLIFTTSPRSSRWERPVWRCNITLSRNSDQTEEARPCGGIMKTRTSGPRYPPQLWNFERSQLGGSWRRLSENKKYFLQTKSLSCPSHCQPSDFLSCHYFQCWEYDLELEQPKKKSPSLYLSKNLENIHRKNSINMST